MGYSCELRAASLPALWRMYFFRCMEAAQQSMDGRRKRELWVPTLLLAFILKFPGLRTEAQSWESHNRVAWRGHLFFLAAWPAQTRNNHTETILIKSLLDPLALASYWLTLIYKFNSFLLICVSPWGRGLPAKFQHVYSEWRLRGGSIAAPWLCPSFS